jgi:acylphosphatase
MKRYKIIIAILKNTLVVILSMQIILCYALGAARDETLPPGKNMNMVDWIQIPMADPFHLIVCSKDVQKELRITQEQLSQFQDMEPLFRSELRELSHLKDQKPRDDIQQHIQAAREGMGRILDVRQQGRLRQLLLQLHGPCSVMNDPKLSVLLKITDQQVNKMKSILHALETKSEQMYTQQRKNNRQTAESGLIGVTTKQQQMKQLLQSLNRKVYSLFSDKQKRIYVEAEGEPFEFKLEDDPVCLDDTQ